MRFCVQQCNSKLENVAGENWKTLGRKGEICVFHNHLPFIHNSKWQQKQSHSAHIHRSLIFFSISSTSIAIVVEKYFNA